MARIAGVVDVPAFADSIPSGVVDEWEQFDAVVPVDHCEKMLGLIAMMVGTYLGHDRDELQTACMPWVDHHADETDAALALFGRAN